MPAWGNAVKHAANYAKTAAVCNRGRELAYEIFLNMWRFAKFLQKKK